MIKIFYAQQVGFMITWGRNFERIPYISLDLPFCVIQIFFKKHKLNKQT